MLADSDSGTGLLLQPTESDMHLNYGLNIWLQSIILYTKLGKVIQSILKNNTYIAVDILIFVYNLINCTLNLHNFIHITNKTNK